ncbi:hypothetical protein SLE2022_113690 [Rubroshorea leprosula]
MEHNPSLSDLLCPEREYIVREVEDAGNFINLPNFIDDEHVQMLVQREISFGLKNEDSLVLSNQIKCARLNAISWIVRNREIFGFRFQTAYLSITYFDRFLSKRSIDGEKKWAIHLLSAACLSLAAKMEELKVPLLPEFQIQEYSFESKVIQRMELLVLNALEWRMSSITPFAFLHYFIGKMFPESPPHHILPTTVHFVMAIIREINLTEHRPSVVAAAATLAALDQRLTRKALECKINSFSSCGFLEIEDVVSCYNLMQKLQMEKLDSSKLINSPEQSPSRIRPVNVLDNSSCSSGTKRKRLDFNNNDDQKRLP